MENLGGDILKKFQYKITDKTEIERPFGLLECYVVESIAKSSLGTTGLEAYFHPDYGFAKLSYTNINGSKTNLTLSEYSCTEHKM